MRNKMTSLPDFKILLFFVLDSYNEEDDCMERRLRVTTLLPSLKGDKPREYVIEWDVDHHHWNIESQDETHYGVSSDRLLNWFTVLYELKMVDYFHWETC